EDEARSELESAGFSVTVEHDRGEPVFGLVYEQSAEAGSELAKGSTVTLTVFWRRAISGARASPRPGRPARGTAGGSGADRPVSRSGGSVPPRRSPRFRRAPR